MSRRRPLDVAVVGAGMVGAALALTLARSGFEVAVIETRAPPPWRAEDEVDLRVVALAASAIALFGELDVWTAICTARACPYRHMRVWDASAPGELGFDAADQDAPVLGYIVENRLIQHTLWQALRVQAGIALQFPARVTATAIDGDVRSLQLDDGRQVAARLVVAADGAESPLRGMLGIATRERDYAQRALVAHVATARVHEYAAWQRFLPGATLAFLPLADGRSSIVWSLAEHAATRLLALDAGAFCAELGAAFDFRLGSITRTGARAAFPLHMRLAERYLAPRCALVGDAAHAVHPLAGQGVNLGLRDAVELAAVLRAARDAGRDFAAESTLRIYERRRRSDNVMAANAFDVIARVFASDSVPLAALRGAALTLVDRLAPLKRYFADRAAGR